ncbi:glycerol-3-phosphate dehydrogenase [Alcanivorax sp. 521-1]|uniref:Glycerol-3-phosphate dehydrogenase n=1 Tax=Alloalcanivorax profundimaris TaxID=2735259 RepID=A0ABS0AUS9_9GAMM|nr:glycerol-3-phosphate dehydrogenase/oxidase [Alloalcanivorax profundimaris]MBF5057367.1 glycerol-3-phosphate dehydrogenase [Alloalcanivorax profundimaris]
MLASRPSLADLAGQQWDLIVVGGGITGAGVLLEAARQGRKALLLEQRDFAWGTSSRSSKMVHGGLRYIAQGDVRLTRDALRERERLLRDLPGLVERATYLFPLRKGRFPGRWPMTAVLSLYDFLAGIRDHRFLSRKELLRRVPGLDDTGLSGAMSYTDALTDDCRLVIRCLLEAARVGGRSLNYARVTDTRREDGVTRVTVRDEVAGETGELSAPVVINATGAWANRLGANRSGEGGAETPRIRPLRGSHLFVDPARLPVDDCLTVMHPRDGRPVFVFPWEGVTCVGTTDLDHGDDLDLEASASGAEVDYLLELINGQFPGAGLTRDDVLSTMAGVRPVIASGDGKDPSKERRDHAVWEHDGLVTVSGGKLTTFRLIALDALAAAGLLDARTARRARRSNAPLFRPLPQAPSQVDRFLHAVQDDDALLRWVLENEAVVHLDDLLLRRTRLGLLRRDGGEGLAERLRALTGELLGWDETRWRQEWARYQDLRARFYGVPPAERAAA